MDDTTNPPPLKRCTKCGEVKPLEMFSKGASKDGLQSVCKSCMSAYNQSRKEEIREQKRGYRAELATREAVPAPLEKQCSRCQTTKLSEDFYPSKTTLDGLRSFCKACESLYQLGRKDQTTASNKALADSRKARTYINIPSDKHCPGCNAIKGSGEFWRDRRSINGLQVYCKTCVQTSREPIREELRARSRQRNRINPTPNRNRMAKWVKENPDKVTVQRHKRRTLLKGNGGHFTHKDIAHMRHIQQGHCCYCGRLGQSLHLEHVIPITQGGPSDPWNLALCCRRCNSSKNNRTLEQWIHRWYLECDE